MTQFVGNHGHLMDEVGWYDLSQNDRDTKVDFRKYVA